MRAKYPKIEDRKCAQNWCFLGGFRPKNGGEKGAFGAKKAGKKAIFALQMGSSGKTR
jgi:hypothetical protein